MAVSCCDTEVVTTGIRTPRPESANRFPVIVKSTNISPATFCRNLPADQPSVELADEPAVLGLDAAFDVRYPSPVDEVSLEKTNRILERLRAEPALILIHGGDRP